jgi:hypothetical protein
MKTLCTALVFLASVTAADAQGLYMLNGRATPSVIVGGAGEVYPVIPNLCHGGPCPVLLAPPLPFRAWAPPPLPPEYYAPVVPRSSAPIYAPPPSYHPAPALPPQARQTEPPRGRGLRSAPPPPIPGAPFERDPDDRGG